jgi:hypothetical protein
MDNVTEDRPECFLCGQKASFYQNLSGIDKNVKEKNRKILGFTVYSCEECREDFEKVVTFRKKMTAIIGTVWICSFLISFLFFHFFMVLLAFVLLGLPILYFIFFLYNLFFVPKIFKNAKRQIQDTALKSGIVISDFNPAWLEIGLETDYKNQCSSCGKSETLFDFELKGSTYLHTTGTIEKQNHYAERKELFLLCSSCADSLRKKLKYSLLVKLLVPSLLGGIAISLAFRYSERPGTPVFQTENWGYLLLFAIVFSFGYAFMIPLSLALFETPWIKRMKIYAKLQAEGFGDSMIRVNRGPKEKLEE